MKQVFLTSLTIILTLVSGAQNVGIGTTTPAARLHVDSAVLFTGRTESPANTPPPVSGSGTRLFWYPSRAAFRSGEVSGTQWDRDNTGFHSFAAGYNTQASGNGTAALGYVTTAAGLYSLAANENTNAAGRSATALGYFTSASGFGSVATGYGTSAKAFNALAAGMYNENSDNPNPNAPDPLDRIFQIGNGSFSVRTNALTILRNGNTGIGMVSPNAPLQFANTLANRKLVLWENANNDHEFYGFGINGSALRYQTASTGSDHIFYAALDPGFSLELMRIKGNGNVGIGAANPTEKLEVAGKTKTQSLQITNGAAAGKMLTSDAAGNASWQDATAANINTGIEVSTFAGQVIAHGTQTQVIFDTEFSDPGTAFNTSTSEWVVSSSGFYHISTAVTFFTLLPANTQVLLILKVNGVNVKRKSTTLTGQSTADISAETALNANDVVTIYIIQNSGAAATINNGRENTYISGYKVY